MSLDRSLLTRSPAKMTLGGGTFYPRKAITIPHKPTWQDVATALHGRVNRYKKDLIFQFQFPVFGLWQSLGVLFPAALLNNVPGASLCSDAPCVIHAKNQDRITFHNAFISKMPELFLGIDDEIFAAEIEITALIKGGANPEDAAAYFTRDTAAYSEAAFSLGAFKAQRYAAVWGSAPLLNTFEMHKGIRISWDGKIEFDYSSNYGTCNAYMGKETFCALVKGIPLSTQATRTYLDSIGRGQGSALGALANPAVADVQNLTITGSGVSIVAKNAFIMEDSENFDIELLRQGEITFCSTTGLAAGAAAVTATVA